MGYQLKEVSWDAPIAEEALELLADIQKKLPYVIANTIGNALAKLSIWEQAKQNGQLIENTTCDCRKLDDDWNAWECSACGLLWELTDGTPFDNEMYYCPKCRAAIKTITEQYFDDDKDDYVTETRTRQEVEKALENESK